MLLLCVVVVGGWEIVSDASTFQELRQFSKRPPKPYRMYGSGFQFLVRVETGVLIKKNHNSHGRWLHEKRVLCV